MAGLDSRVLHGRVNLHGLSWERGGGGKCSAVDSPGDQNLFWLGGGGLGQTIDRVIGSACRMIKLISGL